MFESSHCCFWTGRLRSSGLSTFCSPHHIWSTAFRTQTAVGCEGCLPLSPKPGISSGLAPGCSPAGDIPQQNSGTIFWVPAVLFYNKPSPWGRRIFLHPDFISLNSGLPGLCFCPVLLMSNWHRETLCGGTQKKNQWLRHLKVVSWLWIYSKTEK